MAKNVVSVSFYPAQAGYIIVSAKGSTLYYSENDNWMNIQGKSRWHFAESVRSGVVYKKAMKKKRGL